jgi:hypothetical protein
MNIRRALLLIFLVQWIIVAQAQSNFDLSGRWTGIVQVPFAKDLVAEYTFIQTGLGLQGEVKLKSLDDRDSSRSRFYGYITDGSILFEGTEFIYKTSEACLAVTSLTFSTENQVDRLKGRWRGDMRLTTCPPMVSGKIELTRSTPPPVKAGPAPSVDTAEIHPEDAEGTNLVNELKRRRYFALIIGVNEYSDDEIVDLDNPVKDATNFRHVLETNYTFDSDNIILLTNPTRTQIVETFDGLAGKITARDHFLIFYAGHGVWDEQLNQGFWLPSDARRTSKAQWLSNGTLRDYITGIRSKHTLLIADACFSGSIFKERAVTFGDSKAILQMYRLTSRKAMTSGALKTVPDESVFVQFLIRNLANNTQPMLASEELFRTFKLAVINNSPNGQVPQYGAIGQSGDEGGDFIFLKR